MIKFFRNFRQRLLIEKLPSCPEGRYLLYAIGEIILVVIGILFESNQMALNTATRGLKWTKSGGLELLALIGNTENELKGKNIDSLIETALFWPTWKPTNFVLNELKSSGKLSLLKNGKIKELLFAWERQIENVNDWNRRMEISSQEIVDYIKTNGSLRNVNHKRISTEKSNLEFNNISLFKDLKFENQIDEKVLYSQFLESVYEETDKLINQILEETSRNN